MFNTDMAIGDEVLQEVLGQQADIQMKASSRSIQKNRIRSFGTKRAAFNCSGSGWQRKTSAALQRAAYLLYRGRGQIESSQMLLFSPTCF
ncbi:hypothetical protein PO124_21495 [Bacillus licheniformis]|nr:hypothetical protein [Bacillus licheniformis]